MQEERFSMLSHGRSHQRVKSHSPEIDPLELSENWEQLSHRSGAVVAPTLKTRQKQAPILAALLTEILSVIFPYQVEPQKVSIFLGENLEIIKSLPHHLQQWLSTQAPGSLSRHQQFTFASVLVDFGGLIWKLSDGQKVYRREVAIACGETALHLLESEKFSQPWGQIHNNLAFAYAERLMGDRAANLSQAFSHYQTAVEVIGRQAFPKHWHRLTVNRSL